MTETKKPRKKPVINQETKMSPQEETNPNLNVAEIDLSKLSIADLIKLKDRINEEINNFQPEMGPNDVLLEYNIKVYTQEGLAGVNAGSSRLNNILSPRLIAKAPNRFEHEFQLQVLEPISADMYDIIEEANPLPQNTNSLETIPTFAQEAFPGPY